MKNRILLLSAYDAVSHQRWRSTLCQMFPEFEWTQLSLPPRHFSWRVRGNSLSWGFSQAEVLKQPYDLLIATSMVDLASLRGFLPALAQIPTLLYFHENQFTYPSNSANATQPHITQLDAAIVSLYSALCADLVVFNSNYNRRTFLSGVQALLKSLPDHVPDGVLEKLSSAVIAAVPLDMELPPITSNQDAGSNMDILELVWNHRWEFDKGPELLLQVVEAVIEKCLPIRFHILGQQFRQQPPEFETIKKLLNKYTSNYPLLQAHMGYQSERDAYFARLAGCDVVLSTAKHDFQGLSILEACALGCTPLCPDDLVYPEYLEQRFLYDSACQSSSTLAVNQIVTRLEEWLATKAAGNPLPKFRPEQYQASNLKKVYLALFESLKA